MTKVPDSLKTPLTEDELQKTDGGIGVFYKNPGLNGEWRDRCPKCGCDDFDIISSNKLGNNHIAYDLRCKKCGTVHSFLD